MSVGQDDPFADAPGGVADLLARAALADRRTHALDEAALAGLLTPLEARLDDRLRAAIEEMLAGIVARIEADLRERAALGEGESVLPRLADAGLIRTPALAAELVARARLDLLAEGLPIGAPDDEQPSVLVRLGNDPDRQIASHAVALMVADHHGADQTGVAAPADLLIELHRALVWAVAAALSEQSPNEAIGEAAQRNLAAHDENARADAVAMRLAAAIDAPPAGLSHLLDQALRDRRLVLFIALIAHALPAEFETVRDVVLDPGGEQLWVMLRALDASRETVARVGLALSEADPRRDIEALADALDTIMALDPARAREAIAPLRLPRDLRAAIRALEKAAR